MKSKILRALKDKKDGYVSGEWLSNEFNVSRTAVWKAIKQLKEQGYVIESVTRKGYRLVESVDTLNKADLESELHGTLVQKVMTFDTIDSTNIYGKKIAAEGCPEGVLIISDEQTAGKGRLGRQWESQKGTGVFMSLVLRPDILPERASVITQIVAAAMQQSIEDVTAVEVGIKWPNDIVYNGKKICGILTEMSAELGGINYIIVGVGVNVNNDQFDSEAAKVAVSLKQITGKDISRKDIVIGFVNHFESMYNDFVEKNDLSKAMAVCREKSIVIGNDIEIISKAGSEYAKALDLTEAGHLLVLDNNGNEKEVYYGEISIRGDFYKGEPR